jgi:hypothetical protein
VIEGCRETALLKNLFSGVRDKLDMRTGKGMWQWGWKDMVTEKEGNRVHCFLAWLRYLFYLTSSLHPFLILPLVIFHVFLVLPCTLPLK